IRMLPHRVEIQVAAAARPATAAAGPSTAARGDTEEGTRHRESYNPGKSWHAVQRPLFSKLTVLDVIVQHQMHESVQHPCVLVLAALRHPRYSSTQWTNDCKSPLRRRERRARWRCATFAPGCRSS